MELVGYVLYEPVGFGSSGPMWRAVDEQGRSFALQILPQTLSGSLEMRIRALMKIQSRHVLRVHQLRKVPDGRHVVLFDLLDGQNLEVLRAGKSFNTLQLNFLALCLARGLADLHAAGLSHGDVSPANVVVTTLGEVKWVDLLGLEGVTPAFSAPEATSSSAACTPSADVYALAQMLLALGMSPTLLGNALSATPEARPSAQSLIDSWQDLPIEGIDLLFGPDLAAAQMRAAGRDITTNAFLPPFGLPSSVFSSPAAHFSPKKDRFRPTAARRISRRAHRLTSRNGEETAKRLRFAIPVLCLTLALMLVPLIVGRPAPFSAALSSDPVSLQTRVPREPRDNTDATPPPTTTPLGGQPAPTSSDNPPASTPPSDLLPPSPPLESDPASAPPKDLLQTAVISDDTAAKRVLQEILDRRAEAFTHDDTRALQALSIPNSVLAKDDTALLEQLRNSGRKVTGLNIAVKTLKIVTARKGEVRLDVTLAQETYTQIDRMGRSHQIPAIPAMRQEILLQGTPWRIASVIRLD